MISGTRDIPPPSYPGRVNFSLYRCKIKQPFYMNGPELSRGASEQASERETNRVDELSHLDRSENNHGRRYNFSSYNLA